MGIADDEFVNPASISQSLRCPACKKVFKDPTYCGALPCEHVFCRGCMLWREPPRKPGISHPGGALQVEDVGDPREPYVTDKKDETDERTHAVVEDSVCEDLSGQDDDHDVGSWQCPVCVLDVHEDALRPHPVLSALINELPVHCERRCGWSGRRQAERKHEEDCPIAELERVQSNIEERDAEIVELEFQQQDQLRRLEAHYTDKRITERDVRISEMEAYISQRDTRLIDLGRQLVEREVRIKELENRLVEQDDYAAAVAAAEAAETLDAMGEPLGASVQATGNEPQSARSAVRVGSSLEEMIAGDDLDM